MKNYYVISEHNAGVIKKIFKSVKDCVDYIKKDVSEKDSNMLGDWFDNSEVRIIEDLSFYDIARVNTDGATYNIHLVEFDDV